MGYLWDNVATDTGARPVTVPDVRAARGDGRRLVCITAYDAPTAALVDAAGVDVVLVGDSLGTVVQGHGDTLPVTLDDMIYHARCVRRALRRALLVVDMPFGTFQQGAAATLANVIRVFKETGCAAVKIEGGERVVDGIAACVAHDMPVMGHLGLTPQSLHALGGYKRQGRTKSAVRRMVDDARRLEDAGVFALVLECVPAEAALAVRQAVAVPTIGIGAGAECDGQILVFHDMVGLLPKSPSFVKRFAELGRAAVQAVSEYGRAVRAGEFPA